MPTTCSSHTAPLAAVVASELRRDLGSQLGIVNQLDRCTATCCTQTPACDAVPSSTCITTCPSRQAVSISPRTAAALLPPARPTVQASGVPVWARSSSCIVMTIIVTLPIIVVHLSKQQHRSAATGATAAASCRRPP